MKDKILRFALCWACLGGSVSHASWIDMKDYQDISDENVVEFFKELNYQFFVPDNKSISGDHITAFDTESFSNAVNLRHKNDIVDCRLDIYNPITTDLCDIYLNIIDENRFLIRSLKLDKVHANYTGPIYSSFGMKLCDFKKIKYYTLAFRY